MSAGKSGASGDPGVAPGGRRAAPGRDSGGNPQAGGGSERQVPFYCPYCGEEDLRPAGPAGGSWQCAACARAFELRFAGLVTPAGGGAVSTGGDRPLPEGKAPR